MESKAEYKSARRSRRMIEEAYLSLMQEKDIQKITVTDIVKRADLNRGTFYAHYENAQAVLFEIENKIIGKMIEFLREVSTENFFHDPLPLLFKVADYLEENSELFRFFLGSRGSEQFATKLKDIFVNQLKNSSEVPDSIKNTSQFIIRVNFFAGGVINMYQVWFRGNLSQSLKEVSIGIGDIITRTFLTLKE